MSREVVLGDGRTLAFADLGDPDGAPVLYLHGAQSSSHEASAFDELARATRVRFIATDRPGCGGSSPHPGRTFLGYADDLVQLADALDLSTFVVAGMSNGGAYALAAGVALGPRVRGVITINATTPSADRAARQALGPGPRLAYALMRTAPGPLSRLLTRSPKDAGVVARQRRASGPDAAVLADPEVASLLRRAAADVAGPNGTAYLAEEMALGAAPWGFDHRAVGQRVEIFTGDRDAGVAYARRWATELPDAGLHVFAGGHLSFLAATAKADIVGAMAALVEAGPTA